MSKPTRTLPSSPPPAAELSDPQKTASHHINEFFFNGVTCALVDTTTSVPLRELSLNSEIKKAAEHNYTVSVEHVQVDTIAVASAQVPKQYNLALKCGVESGMVVFNVGIKRGDFVPNLRPGRYGLAHTNLGNLIATTKRIITGNGNINVIFGINPDEWIDGLNSCMLVHPDLEGGGAINLLADSSYQLIEPSVHPITGKPYRFFTPYFHIEGAGSGFSPDRPNARYPVSTYPLYDLGIMTLNRQQLGELLRGFNEDWSNGCVFARKNRIPLPYATASSEVANDDHHNDGSNNRKKRGLDKWC